MTIKKKPIGVPKKVTKKEEPKANVQATKGTKANQKVLKEGEPLEHSKMHNINKEAPKTVGVNIGVTKNMGDFESLRIDCWLTDTMQENETHGEAITRLMDIASTKLEEHLEELAN